MSRPACALVDTGALKHNLQEVRRHAPQARTMAIVKANAYGHGLAWAARVLNDVTDAFGVSSIEEALKLREAGITRPICLLEGFFTADEMPVIAKHRLAPVIHHEKQLQALIEAPPSLQLSVWLKIDTGMHRLGFAPAAVPDALKKLRSCSAVSEIRVMSHFARADMAADSETKTQIENFKSLTGNLGLESSLANSAGILAWPQSHLDWVRPGIMLYGISPMEQPSVIKNDLKPVMTLQTALIAVHPRRKGEAIGYGGDWRCPQDMLVGVAAIGYGDGYPRHARAGTPVLVNGQRVPLFGRVSMDMITLDLRTQPRASEGDSVVLWGPDLPVEEIAHCASTISYELLCHVTERVPRVAV
jgi:alanine racemase